MNGFDENAPDLNVLVQSTKGVGFKDQPVRRNKQLGDYAETFVDGIRPATSAPLPMGPANFPAAVAPPSNVTDSNGWLQAIYGMMARAVEELVRQNIASRPVIRSKVITDAGQTLDWSTRGTFDRLLMRNKGPNSAWFAFNMNGPAVNPTTCDLSFELQANESVNLTHCQFEKVGLKCSLGQTATISAIAFQTPAGNQAGTIA